jgi:ParB-like chromosome segregation protein Spo0J
VKLDIDSLVIDHTVDVRGGVDRAAVQSYMEVLDAMPPIVVFDGGLVADGFHRVEAAKRLGRSKIEATVKRGDRTKALIFAATANTTHGKPLTQKERRAAAERLLRMTKRSLRVIATELGMSPSTVEEIAHGRKVAVRIRTPDALTPSHLDMISRGPEETWQSLADAAAERGWTAHETRMAAQVVKDERTPAKHREEVLAGKADPFPLNEQGEPTVSTDTISRRSKEAKRHGLSGPLHTLLAAAATLEDRIANGEEFERRLSPSDRQRLDRDLERFAEFIPHLRSALVGGLRPVAIEGGKR